MYYVESFEFPLRYGLDKSHPKVYLPPKEGEVGEIYGPLAKLTIVTLGYDRPSEFWNTSKVGRGES